MKLHKGKKKNKEGEKEDVDPATMQRGKLLGECVVKLQRPLASNDRNPPVMMYNEDRTLMDHLEYKFIAHVFSDGSEKIYALAKVFERGIEIIKRVEDQPW